MGREAGSIVTHILRSKQGLKCGSSLASCRKDLFLPSVTQWCLQAADSRCRDVVGFIYMLGEGQKLFDLPRSSWLVDPSQLVNYLSFLAVIVSIDTTRHLIPTGLYNLVFQIGTHKSARIPTHWHAHTHAQRERERFLNITLPICLRCRLF